jgi:hypothetical protein
VDSIQRIGRDLRRLRHVDAYVVAPIAVVLAALSLLSDVVSEDLRWAAALAALGLLVYRVTLPDGAGDVDEVLQSRLAFADITFGSRLKRAKVVWVFAPSAINLLTSSTADDLRRTVLARPDGSVRVAVLDPEATAAVALASRQLDDSVDFAIQDLPEELGATVSRLRAIAGWKTEGHLDYRFASFNPGFSLVAVDPHERHGVLIVEFHGFHNESSASRMHIELRRQLSEHWYEYWIDQFEHLWTHSRPAHPSEGGED